MDSLYFTGWALAMVVGLIKTMTSAYMANSIKAKNLKNVGLHYSPWSGTFIENKTSIGSWIFCAFYAIGLAPIFSWLAIISTAASVISSLINRVDPPEKLKTLQYKLATMQLSKDDVLKLLQEVNEVMNPNSPIEAVDEDSLDDFDDGWQKLVLSEGDWYADMELNPKEMRVRFRSHPPDYDGIHTSEGEYKFEGSVVLIRIIENSVEHYGKRDYHIKDNVVLESEIRARHSASKVQIETIDEELERFQKQVNWSQVLNYKYKYFILSKHPELFSQQEFRKLVRLDLERIRLGFRRFENEATRHGAELKYPKGNPRFILPQNSTEESKNAISKLFNEVEKFGISESELLGFNELEKDLLSFLENKKAS